MVNFCLQTKQLESSPACIPFYLETLRMEYIDILPMRFIWSTPFHKTSKGSQNLYPFIESLQGKFNEEITTNKQIILIFNEGFSRCGFAMLYKAYSNPGPPPVLVNQQRVGVHVEGSPERSFTPGQSKTWLKKTPSSFKVWSQSPC